ncbi:membrane dipeptidase [Steroidobacter sp.]
MFNVIPEYNEPRRFMSLADDLSRKGWSERRIEKILGGNFVRLFADVWGA